MRVYVLCVCVCVCTLLIYALPIEQSSLAANYYYATYISSILNEVIRGNFRLLFFFLR